VLAVGVQALAQDDDDIIINEDGDPAAKEEGSGSGEEAKGGAKAGGKVRLTSVEKRVKRARTYEKQGVEFVEKAIEAQKKIRKSVTVRARNYRSNLKRAATAYRKARALVLGRKDDLSKKATTEITKGLIDVLNNLARAYVDIGSLTRATALVKEILKLDPKDHDALKTKREIAEAKKKDPKESGGEGRWSLNRPWRIGSPRPPTIPNPGGAGGGR
jgi:tetratricopeptide (TPR) repeat protein